MLKKPRQRTWDGVLEELRRLQFDVQPVQVVANQVVANQVVANQVVANQGVANQQRISKYGCAIVLEKADNAAGLRMVVRPGLVMNGEIAHLVDRGFQKFFHTSKTELPATADRLTALHTFVEELKEVTGSVTLYNEALGTVSDAYLYDRVKGRDLPESQRPVAGLASA